MSTSRSRIVDDDLIPEFDFRRAIPSPYRDRARAGMRFNIRTDGADLPVYHVQAVPRGRAWWIEVAEIDGSGRSVRWASIESAAREIIARAEGIGPADFDLVIELLPTQ